MNAKSIAVVLLGLVGSAAAAVTASDKGPAPAEQAAQPSKVEVQVGRPATPALQGPAVSVKTGPGGPSVVVQTPDMPRLAPADQPVSPQEVPQRPPVDVHVDGSHGASVAAPGVSVHAGPGGASVIVDTPVLRQWVPMVRPIRPRVVVVPVSSHDRVDRLVDRLQHGTPLLSQRAARVLTWLNDPRAVAPLIGVLGDDNPSVRRSAASVLRSITGQDFGEDQAGWKAWYEGSLEQAVPQPN